MYYQTDYLSHYGIKGQKWGVRRFQNEDGSYTEEGKLRYNSVRDSQKDIHSVSGHGGTFGGVGRTGTITPDKAGLAIAVSRVILSAARVHFRKKRIKKELKENGIESNRLNNTNLNKLAGSGFNKKERQMVYDKLKANNHISYESAIKEAKKSYNYRKWRNTGIFLASVAATAAYIAFGPKIRDSLMRNKNFTDFMSKIKYMKMKDAIVLRPDEAEIDSIDKQFKNGPRLLTSG